MFKIQAAGLFLVLLLVFIALSGCISEDSSGNNIPVPRITLSNTYPNQGEFFNFSALDSIDEDGDIISYHWDFGDGTTTNVAEGVYHYEGPGTFDITLIVTDRGDAKALANRTIKVNGLPTARIGMDKPSAQVYEPIQFSASGSTDPDDGITRYEWDFGDGSVSTSQEPHHAFNDVGNYEVTLKVFDGREAGHMTRVYVDIFPRSYMITWKKSNNTASFNDFTMEEDTTNKTYSLSQVDLIKVEVTLEWDDDFPFTFVENESTPDPDTYDLYVESPEGKQKRDNSTSGRIFLSFTIGTIPKAFQVTAKDEVEAAMLAEERTPPDDTETGTWLMSVTAVYCPGNLWKNGVLEIDPGNSWRMTFNYYYYEMVVTEE